MIISEKFIKLHTGLNNVTIVPSCVSTFDEIGESDVIIAGQQSRGRGRGDHSFFCPNGGIYMVMRLMGLYIDAHTLTPTVGLAVRDAARVILGIDTRLKWVNDVMYKDKKVAGILCKSPRRGEYLIGIGINYNIPQEEFISAGLDDVATSFLAPENRASAFITGLINRIKRLTLAAFDNERYSALCINVGKTVEFTYNGTRVKGYAERVDADGSLIVRIGAATVAVDAGEVSIIRNTD